MCPSALLRVPRPLCGLLLDLRRTLRHTALVILPWTYQSLLSSNGHGASAAAKSRRSPNGAGDIRGGRCAVAIAGKGLHAQRCAMAVAGKGSHAQIGRHVLLLSAFPQANPLAQAHWKLYPPSQPVTSTTSPMKYRPGCFDSMVRDDKSRVSTPPAVTSAFL